MQKKADHKHKTLLSKYTPHHAVDTVYSLIKHHRIMLTISQDRKTKQGDYRPPILHTMHRISVNNNLNQYAFLLTLIHEIAHLEVWKKYGSKVRPHGKEWQKSFQMLMSPLMNEKCFPSELLPFIKNHLAKGYASTLSDLQLTRALMKYDESDTILIEDVPDSTIFTLEDGRTFRKKNRLKKRYLCYCFNDKKNYLFSPVARVNLSTEK